MKLLTVNARPHSRLLEFCTFPRPSRNQQLGERRARTLLRNLSSTRVNLAKRVTPS